MLSHRSGLPSGAWGGPGGWRNGGGLELRFEPGTAYGYSGAGFNYLSRVVEELIGKTIEQVLSEEVVEPMGLTNTLFALKEKQAQTASIGHWHTFPTWKWRAWVQTPLRSWDAVMLFVMSMRDPAHDLTGPL